MPRHKSRMMRAGHSAAGSGVVSQFQIRKIAGRSAAGSSSTVLPVRAKAVEVATAGWTSDNALHPNAPEVLYYADLQHNLSSPYAHVEIAVMYDDYLEDLVQFQKRDATNRNNKLRVWCYFDTVPTYTITFWVVG